MDSSKLLMKQTGQIALGQLVCCGIMAAVFAVAGKWNTSVLLGAAVGGSLATVNFFVMAFCANAAADKAEAQDIKGGQALIQMSYMGRLIGLFLILALCAKSGIFNLIALVLPLAFTRPILTITELFKKKGGNIK